MNNDRFKFRVWDNVSKKYRHYLYLDQCGNLRYPRDRGIQGCEMVTLTDSCNYTIEQCTGDHDRRGNLIYEGDVLLIGTWRNQQRRGNVVFSDGCWWVQNKAKSIALLGSLENEKIQIVGNIHEREAKK